MPNMIHISSLVMKKMQFNHFLIISLWSFLLPRQENQEADHHNFSCPYSSNIHTKLVILLQWLWRSIILKFLFQNLMLSWQPNKMVIGNKTHKLPGITKTRLYNVDPLKPHFYIVKLGFTGVYIIFLISAQKHILWVLVRTASPRRF